ncbi:hypothetical protein [Oxynema aestuarii]|uniref:Uncharacterized protein n=1 Tax=Oxynema aestuarii AP17 TaxID=2064643 RepID=A0A6H1TZZ5_9CYAN|nr:hypothetical protein [Oxynema aestuarii]QIZ72182.1 hypothetical protein HCG48_17715 [Oxynema aestuarii AP17]
MLSRSPPIATDRPRQPTGIARARAIHSEKRLKNECEGLIEGAIPQKSSTAIGSNFD